MEVKDMICIVCPKGCKMQVIKTDDSQAGYHVEGNKCFRGVDYGIKEMTNPTRVLTTTIRIADGSLNRLPVRTTGAIPKHLIMQAMDLINKVEVKAPIKVGQVVIKNILDTGEDIIASRSMYQNFQQEDYLKDYLVQG
jgi:CxxC motif-containing protein